DDLILKRMKRRHSRTQAIAAAHRARSLRPEIAIGADLIAGFPTETGSMFRNSLDHVAECGIAFLHVFPYSPRPGTPAARMPQLDPAADTDTVPADTTTAAECTSAVAEIPAPAQPGGWLDRLRSGLSRSSTRLNEGINTIFLRRRLDAAALAELEELLIASDMG